MINAKETIAIKISTLLFSVLVLVGCSEHLAPVLEGVTDITLADEYKGYMPEIRKATEIQRRNKKCKEVGVVGLSVKNVSEELKIFVTCHDFSGDSFNTFYSLNEVNEGYERIKSRVELAGNQ